MIRGNQNIIQWFTGTGLRYWLVYHKAGGVESGQYAARSSDADDVTNNTALDDLKRWMGIIRDNSEYLLVASATPKLTPKGYSKEFIEILRDAPNLPGTNGAVTPAVSGLTEEDVNKRIKSALADYKNELKVAETEKELAELKKKYKVLEQGSNDPLNRIIAAVAPYSEQIVAGLFGSRAQVAGLPKPTTVPDINSDENEETMETLTPQQEEAVQNFIDVLSQTDKDWVETIKRMTAKIKKDPGVVKMIKNFM